MCFDNECKWISSCTMYIQLMFRYLVMVKILIQFSLIKMADPHMVAPCLVISNLTSGNIKALTHALTRRELGVQKL